MARICDVARQAGVSKTLVSRVINNQRGVSEASRERILQAMKVLNYTPNALAKSLVLGKTKTIGVVLDTLCEPYYFELIRGIEDRIAESDYSVVFCSGNEQKDVKSRYIRFFQQGRTDGVILYGSRLSDNALIEQLARTGFPFVVIENEIKGLVVNNVIVDNAFGSDLAVGHLVDCGCRSILHVTGDLNVQAAIDRLNGFIAATRIRKMMVGDTSVVESGFTVESGYETIRKYLDDKGAAPLVDAIYFGSDATAFGGMMALEDAGIEVPAQIMVVGFDDDRPYTIDRPLKKLTTLRQPLYGMGKSAAGMLLDEIERTTEGRQKELYYPELVCRETTVLLRQSS